MSLLFTPGTIGGLTLDNRLVVSPMCQYSAVDGVAQPWHLIHLGQMMMSGAGLVIIEATAVEPRGMGTPGDLGLWSDAQETALRELLGQLRGLSGARIGLQLFHAGRKAATRTIPDRWQGEPMPARENPWLPRAPSAIAYDDGWQVPEELDEAGIAGIIASFAAAAKRALSAGVDLIEIHGAHGYLIHEFLSPLTNRRTDRWGGALENRNRFLLEIARAIRTVWPRDRALGVRLNSTDWAEGGSTLEDAVALAAALRADGVDYAVMSSGNIAPGLRIPPAAPAHQAPFAEAVRQRAGITAMAVGMILDAETAERILADGQADFIAVGRAVLDDPRWGLHAAAVLGEDMRWPPQYLRARPNNWTGYARLHPQARPPATAQQLDRPKSAAFDRPGAR